jgi:hypothetical protein
MNRDAADSDVSEASLTTDRSGGARMRSMLSPGKDRIRARRAHRTRRHLRTAKLVPLFLWTSPYRIVGA